MEKEPRAKVRGREVNLDGMPSGEEKKQEAMGAEEM